MGGVGAAALRRGFSTSFSTAAGRNLDCGLEALADASSSRPTMRLCRPTHLCRPTTRLCRLTHLRDRLPSRRSTQPRHCLQHPRLRHPFRPTLSRLCLLLRPLRRLTLSSLCLLLRRLTLSRHSLLLRRLTLSRHSLHPRRLLLRCRPILSRRCLRPRRPLRPCLMQRS